MELPASFFGLKVPSQFRGCYSVSLPPNTAVSPIARIHGSRKHRVEMEMASLTITPTDPLEKFLLPIPMTQHSGGLGVLVPEKEIIPPRDTTMIPFTWKLILLPGHCGLLMPLKQ